MNKTYLGNGVYVHMEYGAIVLVRDDARIALEMSAMDRLLTFLEALPVNENICATCLGTRRVEDCGMIVPCPDCGGPNKGDVA